MLQHQGALAFAHALIAAAAGERSGKAADQGPLCEAG